MPGSLGAIELTESLSFPLGSIDIIAQGTGDDDDFNRSVGNIILGTMSILAGMEADGTPVVWGDTRPQPTEFTCITSPEWPALASDFKVYDEQAQIRDNLWQDIFAWSNAGLGHSWTIGGAAHPNTSNNHVNRTTIYNNGQHNHYLYGGNQTDAQQSDIAHFDSNPDGSRNPTSMSGEGARLTHRYVDGVLTEGPLWPWPMEDRIQAELGYSVTDLMTSIIFGE